MNEGKKFEQDFIKSINVDHVLVKRLADNPLAFEGGGRFSTNNECDYLLFDSETRTLYGLELKTTLSSLTYWREDYEDETHKNFNIRKCQIQGLKKWSQYNGVFGFVINFRKAEKTYFVSIEDFLTYTEKLGKKSVNIEDIRAMNPVEIDNVKKRSRYTYDIEKFIRATAFCD